MKKGVKEITRLNNSVKEMKEKIDALKNSEKTLTEEKNQLIEKLKSTKNDVQRKEIFIKELKDKIENENKII